MKIVGAALGAKVENASGDFAPVRANIICLYFEFSDGVLRRNQDGQVDISDIERLTIEVFGALIGKSAADLEVAPCKRILTSRSLTRLSLHNHGWRDLDEAEYVAAVQGQFVGVAFFHHLTERGGLRLQEWNVGSDGDRLAGSAHVEPDVNPRRLLHLNNHVLPVHALEPALLDREPVLTGI